MRQSFNGPREIPLSIEMNSRRYPGNSISSLEGKPNMFRIFTGSKTTARQQERTTNQPIASNAPKTMNQEPTNCQLARRQELRTKNQVQGIKNQEPCTRYQVNSDLYSTFLLQCFLPHSLFLQSSDELHTRLLSIACQEV